MGNEGHNADQALKQTIEKIEILNAEMEGLRDDIKEVKQKAKEDGLDVPMLMAMVKLRKMDKELRQKKEELRDRYLTALDLI